MNNLFSARNTPPALDNRKFLCYNIAVLYNSAISKGGITLEERKDTLKEIHQAAMEEFLEKGFADASLRQIVKNAGVTTGAFYGYYSSKEALFTALVEPHAAAVMGIFMGAQTAFAEMPEAEQPSHVGVESSECVKEMLDYVYQHLEPFKLLVCKAQGTSYENFIHNMVEIEVEATQRFMEVLRRQGREIPDLDDQLCHIIASGMFHGIFEVVVHDMPYDRAKCYVQQLQDFFLAGWHSMMGV